MDYRGRIRAKLHACVVLKKIWTACSGPEPVRADTHQYIASVQPDGVVSIFSHVAGCRPSQSMKVKSCVARLQRHALTNAQQDQRELEYSCDHERTAAAIRNARPTQAEALEVVVYASAYSWPHHRRGSGGALLPFPSPCMPPHRPSATPQRTDLQMLLASRSITRECTWQPFPERIAWPALAEYSTDCTVPPSPARPALEKPTSHWPA